MKFLLRVIVVGFLWAITLQCAQMGLGVADHQEDYSALSKEINLALAWSYLPMELVDIRNVIERDEELLGIYTKAMKNRGIYNDLKKIWRDEVVNLNGGEERFEDLPNIEFMEEVNFGWAIVDGNWWIKLAAVERNRAAMSLSAGNALDALLVYNETLIEGIQKFIEKVFVNGEEPRNAAYKDLVAKKYGEVNHHLKWIKINALSTLRNYAQSLSGNSALSEAVKCNKQVGVLVEKQAILGIVASLQKLQLDKCVDEALNLASTDLLIFNNFTREFNNSLELVRLQMLLGVVERARKAMEIVLDYEFPTLVCLARHKVVFGGYNMLDEEPSMHVILSDLQKKQSQESSDFAVACAVTSNTESLQMQDRLLLEQQSEQ